MKHLIFSGMVIAGLAACSSSPEQDAQTEAATEVVTEQAAEMPAEKKQAKYGFSYLESVKVISDFRMTSFQGIDSKSLIIRSEDRSYLLVLSKGNQAVTMTHHIFIGSKGRMASSSIASGIDKLAVNAGFSSASSISNIHVIADAAEEEKVKRQVLGDEFATKLPKEHQVRGVKEVKEVTEEQK